MKPFYQNEYQTLYQGDAREVLPILEPQSVDMIMTSPPFYGLRKYDGEPVVWDSVDGCQHEWGKSLFEHDSLRFRGQHSTVGSNANPEIHMGKVNSAGNFCLKCHAWRGMLGLEPTPELYIKHLCDIFDLCKRVLKPTGVLFVNIDDSYAGSWGDSGHRPERDGIAGTQRGKNTQWLPRQGHPLEVPPTARVNIPAKSLIGIPERFVLEMLNRGWIRRSTIIWYKGNPMPESVKDRFTSDFEYLYLFSQQGDYYFEQQFEPHKDPEDDLRRIRQARENRLKRKANDASKDMSYLETWSIKEPQINPLGRNKRCVWKINTKPYKHAHFATYPPELCETPIMAGCPVGGTVLDPFSGSGTTLEVALKLGRKSIGIDISQKYCKLAMKRPAQLGVSL